MPNPPLIAIPDKIHAVEGESGAVTFISLKQAGFDPIDLSTADSVAISAFAADGSSVISNINMDIWDAADGIVTFTSLSAHTGTVGVFQAEIAITWNDTSVNYVPSRGKILFIVREGVV